MISIPRLRGPNSQIPSWWIFVYGVYCTLGTWLIVFKIPLLVSCWASPHFKELVVWVGFIDRETGNYWCTTLDLLTLQWSCNAEEGRLLRILWLPRNTSTVFLSKHLDLLFTISQVFKSMFQLKLNKILIDLATIYLSAYRFLIIPIGSYSGHAL